MEIWIGFSVWTYSCGTLLYERSAQRRTTSVKLSLSILTLECKSGREYDPANGVHSEYELDHGTQKTQLFRVNQDLIRLPISPDYPQVLNLTFMWI